MDSNKFETDGESCDVQSSQTSVDTSSGMDQSRTVSNVSPSSDSHQEMTRSQQTKSREVMEEKMNNLFKTLEPFVRRLDEHVIAVRTSQELLNQELNNLITILTLVKSDDQRLNEHGDIDPDELNNPNIVYAKPATTRPLSTINSIGSDISADLEEKSRRLLGLKRRLTLVHSILQTVNSRTKKLLLAHNSRI